MANEFEERYPGEHDSLTRFLQGLEPAIRDQLGDNSMLEHAIKRALKQRRLAQLRHARDIFNLLPRDIRDTLSSQLIDKTEALDDLITDEDDDQGAAIIRFEASTSNTGIQVSRHPVEEKNSDPVPSDIAVDIQPGTLPTFAAAKLRLIAGSIEANKEILSDGHWQKRTEKRKIGPHDH